MPQPGETTAVPKRWRRRVWVVLFVLTCLASVVALLYFVALPIWIHGKLIAALRDAGASDVSLRVDGVSPWRMDLSDSSLGRDQRFHVRSIGASYDLNSLQKGEVGQIDFDGAVFDLRVRNGVVDMGPFAEFKSAVETSAPSAPASVGLPFKRLEVRRSAVIFDWQGIRLHVPVECTITNEGAASIGLDATVTLLDLPVRVHGVLTPPTQSGALGEWGVDLSVDEVTWSAMGMRVSAKSMTITGKVVPAGKSRGMELKVALKGGAVSGGGHSFGEITAEMPISSAAGEGVNGAFRIGSVLINDRKMPAISGTMDASEGKARFTADWPALKYVAISSKGWIDAGLNGEVSADVAAFELADAKELAQLMPALARLDLIGKTSLSAKVVISSGQATPSVTVRTSDVRIADKESGVVISGINGDVTFDPRAPLASAGGQRISGAVAIGGGAAVNNVALRFGSLSPTRLELLDFALGKDQRFAINALNATFNKTTLDNGGVDVLNVEGASLELRVRDGTLDLGALTQLIGANEKKDAELHSPPAVSDGKPAFHLPFQRLEVRHSAVIVDWQGVRVQLPIECTITSPSAGLVGVDITASVLDLPMRLHGTLTEPSAGAGAWGVDLVVDPLTWTGSGLTASVKSVTVNGKITPGGEKGTAVELQAVIVGGAVKREGDSLSEITATVPIVFNSDAPAIGQFSVGKVVSGERELPPISGTTRFVEGRAEFSADWPLLKAAPIAAKGWIDSGLHAEVTAAIAPFELKEAKELNDLMPALAPLDLNGTFSVDASVKLVDGKLTPRVTLHAKDARFADKEAGLSIEGINGDVAFTRFSTLGTRGGQKITVKKMTLGDVTLIDGETSFQVERPDSFLIEKTLWHWDDGGLMRFYGARIEPGKGISVEVFLEDIAVQRWIALLVNAIGGEATKVEGEGKMFGRVPVTFDPADTEHPLAFGRGFLYANPGGGWYRLSDKTFISAMMAGLNVQSVSEDARARFEEGLSNFEYSTLTFEFVPVPAGLRGVLFAKGKNHNPDKPINFQGLTANFNGLDQGLNVAVVGKTSYTKMTDAFKSWFKPR